MASRGAVLFVAMLGGAAALATGKPADRHNGAICGVICVDAVNECGEKYGGCYDPCLETAPTAPPCPAVSYTNIWYPTPPPTAITPVTKGEIDPSAEGEGDPPTEGEGDPPTEGEGDPPTEGEGDPSTEGEIDGEIEDCSTIIVCVDGVNECGIPFGACIPSCKPWNITIPTCPPETDDTLEAGPGVAVEEPDGADELGDVVPWTPERGLGRRGVVEEPEASEASEELGDVVPWTPERRGLGRRGVVEEPEASEASEELGDVVPWTPERRALGRRGAVDEPEGADDLGDVVPWTPETKGPV